MVARILFPDDDRGALLSDNPAIVDALDSVDVGRKEQKWPLFLNAGLVVAVLTAKNIRVSEFGLEIDSS